MAAVRVLNSNTNRKIAYLVALSNPGAKVVENWDTIAIVAPRVTISRDTVEAVAGTIDEFTWHSFALNVEGQIVREDSEYIVVEDEPDFS